MHWPSARLEEPGGYAADDRIIPAALDSPASFTWDEFLARRPGERARAFAVVEAFGWRVGLVVPVHGPGDERGIVSLAARRLTMTSEDRVWIEKACLLAYRRGRFLTATRGAPGLTEREGEALALVALGHDDFEIGEALRVSKATAHAHVERAKRRLGARSRSHAVAIAMSRGLI